MNKKTIGLIIPVILIVSWLFLINYSDFLSKENLAAFLGILSMMCLILGYFARKNSKQ